MTKNRVYTIEKTELGGGNTGRPKLEQWVMFDDDKYTIHLNSPDAEHFFSRLLEDGYTIIARKD